MCDAGFWGDITIANDGCTVCTSCDPDTETTTSACTSTSDAVCAAMDVCSDSTKEEFDLYLVANFGFPADQVPEMYTCEWVAEGQNCHLVPELCPVSCFDGCAVSCLDGYFNSATANTFPICNPVACPQGTTGSSVPEGCECGPGSFGNVTATSTAPYLTSTCVCKAGHTLTGSVMSLVGCFRKLRWVPTLARSLRLL